MKYLAMLAAVGMIVHSVAGPVVSQDIPKQQPVSRLEQKPQEPDWIARTIAIVAVVLSLGAFGLGIYNAWWDRQKWNKSEEEKAQRVKATLTVDCKEPIGLGLHIVSIRPFPIPIEKVQIETARDEKGLSIGVPFLYYDDALEPTFSKEGYKLEPHTDVTFYLRHIDQQVLTIFLNLKPCDLWIAVYSTQGEEIARVKGESVQFFLQQLSHGRGFAH